MTDCFIDISRKIANDYIQSVVFIDDMAFSQENPVDSNKSSVPVVPIGDKSIIDKNKHAFDAYNVSKIFAAENKICAVYAPESQEDISFYSCIAAKADATVIDWYIFTEQNLNSDPEADANDDDPRGIFALNLISECLRQQAESLNLFIVYTGDDDLGDITNKIYAKIAEVCPNKFQIGDCIVYSSNVRIVVLSKATSGNQFKQHPEWQNNIVDYQDLPARIVDEFVCMTNGLLSNFALSAITAIRENTSRMLRVFSPDLDPAYLGHKVLLEDTSESKHMLIKLFGEAISELLEVTDIDTEAWVENWIESNIKEENIDYDGTVIRRTMQILKDFIHSVKFPFKEKCKEVFGQNQPKVEKDTAKLFKVGNVDIDKANIAFAKLTHHKNAFKPLSGVPVLTLGSIVKKDGTYFVCIQQRCESVRIKDNNERRFLFLPLTDNIDSKNNPPIIIVENGEKLTPVKASFSIKTIKFSPKPNETIIRATQNGGKYMFTSVYGEQFEWIVDLKDLHAQRIVNSYCAQLSRVGLNESEWLRLSAK